jgi:hypothetical protein
MRLLLAVMTACLLLSGISLSGGGSAQNAPAPAAAPPKPPAPAAATSADNEAAAKHAKRTACIKEARAKKLVGAQKTAYIKDCAATP